MPGVMEWSGRTDMTQPEQVAPAPTRVLVVDDERNIRKTLAICLQGLDCAVVEAGSADNALEALSRSAFDLAFVDLRLGKEDGLALLPKLLAARPGLDVVMITAYAAVDTAVEAMRRGAKDYLPKPFTPSQIRRAVEQARARREIETGLARALHQLSPRRTHPFAVVNCPALTEELLASEMFGHVEGAFTGAVRERIGRVEAAEGGTLFLDEIAEMPAAMQAKLLRFIQDKQFERVGETRTRKADVRIVAATNRDLDAAVKVGQFREDLLFRLNVVEVTVPPLRERRDEILPLARRFLTFFARAARKAPPELSPESERVLLAYPWPGNVRELRNAIERAVILSSSQVLAPEAFPERIVQHAAQVAQVGGDFTVEAVEREHILRVLARTRTQDLRGLLLGAGAGQDAEDDLQAAPGAPARGLPRAGGAGQARPPQ